MKIRRSDASGGDVERCVDVLTAFGVDSADIRAIVSGASRSSSSETDESLETAVSELLLDGRDRTALLCQTVCRSDRGLVCAARYSHAQLGAELADVFGAIGLTVEVAETDRGVALAVADGESRQRETTITYPETPLGEDNLPAVIDAINDDLLDGADSHFVLLSDGTDRWQAALAESADLDQLRERYGDRLSVFDRPLLPTHEPGAYVPRESRAGDREPWPAWAVARSRSNGDLDQDSAESPIVDFSDATPERDRDVERGESSVESAEAIESEIDSLIDEAEPDSEPAQSVEPVPETEPPEPAIPESEREFAEGAVETEPESDVSAAEVEADSEQPLVEAEADAGTEAPTAEAEADAESGGLRDGTAIDSECVSPAAEAETASESGGSSAETTAEAEPEPPAAETEAKPEPPGIEGKAGTDVKAPAVEEPGLASGESATAETKPEADGETELHSEPDEPPETDPGEGAEPESEQESEPEPDETPESEPEADDGVEPDPEPETAADTDDPAPSTSSTGEVDGFTISGSPTVSRVSEEETTADPSPTDEHDRSMGDDGSGGRSTADASEEPTSEPTAIAGEDSDESADDDDDDEWSISGSTQTTRVSNDSFGTDDAPESEDDRYRAVGAALMTGRNVSVSGLLEDEEFLPRIPTSGPKETRIQFEESFDPDATVETQAAGEASGFVWVDSGLVEKTRSSNG